MPQYKYKVVQNNMFKYDRRHRLGDEVAYDRPENSKALEPLDDFTRKATDALKLEHKKHYERQGPIAGDEAADLREKLSASEERHASSEARFKKLEELLAKAGIELDDDEDDPKAKKAAEKAKKAAEKAAADKGADDAKL
jgi:hypothetical protein